MKSKLLAITLHRQHAIETHRGVLSHEILDLKAGTYHKLVFPNGTILYVNDFGVSAVLVQYDSELQG